MDFTATKGALLHALTPAARIAARKSSMPILGCALIEASADGIEIMATDTFQSSRALANARVARPGSVCVPAVHALAVFKSLDDGDVRVRTTETGVEVSKGKSRVQIPMQAAENFPALRSAPASMATLDASSLLSAIVPALPFMCTDDTREHLARMRVDIARDRIRATTTDGNSLCTSEVAYESEVVIDAHVPHRSVGELRALLESVTGAKVRIALHDRHLFVVAAQIELCLLLADGNAWPPIHTVLASALREMRHDAIVANAPLAASVRRAKLASDKVSTVWLRFDEGSLHVRGGSENGTSVDELPFAFASKDAGADPDEHGISSSMTIDALSSVGSDEVCVRWGAPLAPLFFERVGEGPRVQVLCMARREVPS